MDSTKDVPLVIDFTGTGPQAKGPINHCGDYADGNFLKKWLAPILRNLAETPERMAQLDVNEGVVPLIEMRFPEKGTLLTPIFPAPTNARTFVILRLLGVLAGVLAKATGGRMPADQETIRYTGVYGTDFDGEPYLMREVLGGGSGGRYYADGEDTIHVVPDSRNLPTEFTEGRFPLRVERLGLALDSGGAGRYRGGCGYEKHIRVLRDAHFMSIADRSILACWGVKGGKAGRPFQVTVDPGGPNEHEVDALADAEPLKAGTVVRIRTTGGGGWGDPLDRPVDEVLRDIAWRKVSVATGARGTTTASSCGDGEDGRRTGRPRRTTCARHGLGAARTGDPHPDEPNSALRLAARGYATLSAGGAALQRVRRSSAGRRLGALPGAPRSAGGAGPRRVPRHAAAIVGLVVIFVFVYGGTTLIERRRGPSAARPVGSFRSARISPPGGATTDGGAGPAAGRTRRPASARDAYSPSRPRAPRRRPGRARATIGSPAAGARTACTRSL